MKKMLAYMLVGAMIFSLAACGGKTEGSGAAEAEPAAESTVGEAAEESEAEEAAEEAKEEAAEEAKEEAAEESEAEEAAEEAKEEAAEESEAEEAAEEAKEEAEEESEDEELIVGGFSEADSPAVTEELKALVEKAAANMDGAAYTPVAYLGSQVVAGTNHAILCAITPVVPDPVGHYAIVVIYEDLEGNAEITEIYDSEAEAFVNAEGLTGGWEVPETPEVTDEAEDALSKALEQMVGADYEPVALVGTQVVSGMNYALLCEVTAVVPGAETEYVLVRVYQDLEGNAEITDTYDFVSPAE